MFYDFSLNAKTCSRIDPANSYLTICTNPSLLENSSATLHVVRLWNVTSVVVTYISHLRYDCTAVHQFVGLSGTQQTLMTDRNYIYATNYYINLEDDESLLLAALIIIKADKS